MVRWQKLRVSPALAAMAGAVIALDQYSKHVVVQFFADRAALPLEIVGDWLRLSLATNSGAAFGLLPQQTGLFVLAALIVVPAIIYFYNTLTYEPWPVRLSLGLLLGGTLGNFVDRLRQGYVVDFIDVGIGAMRWPSFNVADSAFVVGTILLAAYVLFWQRERPHEQRAGDGAA